MSDIDLQKFVGTGVAMVTPFGENKTIDFLALEKLIEYLLANKVEYLVALGTTGETPTLSHDEKFKILEFVVKQVQGRVPIVAGFGGNNTKEVTSYLTTEDLTGVDGILSVSPYYNKPTQEGIYRHYMEIADATELPVIIYNVPSRTGTNITSETTLRLAKDAKNIIAVKEASGDMDQCMYILNNKPEDFLVISGDDALTLPFISIGMDGVISVIANAFPADFSEMVRLALAGNTEESKKIHYNLLEMIDLIFQDGSPGGIKAILSMMDICKNELRLPLVPVGDKTLGELKKAVKDYDLTPTVLS